MKGLQEPKSTEPNSTGYGKLALGAVLGGAVGLAALPALGVAIGVAAAGPVAGGAFAAA